MKSIALSLISFLSFNAFATELTAIDKPTSVKVRAAAASWEKIYTPNLCYPDAVTYKISALSTSNWQNLILAAAIATSDQVRSFSSFRQLSTKQQVVAKAKDLQSGMGVRSDKKLEAQLVRVFEKQSAREIYSANTIGGNMGLEGEILAILDHENSEVVLLTTGDAFDSSSCSDE
jgi:hypothetical protein